MQNQRPALVVVRVDGEESCRVAPDEPPCEKTFSLYVNGAATVELIEPTTTPRAHDLPELTGWLRFSVRVNERAVCQANCALTEREHDASAALTQIRFQPFYVGDAEPMNAHLVGHGLFMRGLQFNGAVTKSSMILSCICDRCKRSFLIHSFHSGFMDVAYFYSGSGAYTMIVAGDVPGAPVALQEPDAAALAALEAALPAAPDGTRFAYTNPFRCPHCKVPYIDFEAHPEERIREYYGNSFVGTELLRFSSAAPQ
jgi:hypothetical protein